MKKNIGQVIAVFDFDGTITTKDSFNDFIVNKYGYINFLRSFLIHSPFVLLYLMKLVDNVVPKQKIFSNFFKGIQASQFSKIALSYSRKRLINILNPSAIERILWHQKQGHKVVIVSASLTEWIEPWALEMGIDKVIATKVEIKNRKLTGILTGNCFGKKKVERFLKEFPNRDSYTLYAYGDHKEDKHILTLADFRFFKPFKEFHI